MRRREFIVGAAAALPFVALAQTKKIPRLGVLLYSNPQSDPHMAAIRRALSDLGYVEGRNILIEYRYAEGRLDRLPILAGQVVGLQPDVILAIGGDVSPTAKKVDEKIPLVFVSSADPEQLVLSKVFVGRAETRRELRFCRMHSLRNGLSFLKRPRQKPPK